MGAAPRDLVKVWTVGHQPAGLDKRTRQVERWKPCRGGEIRKAVGRTVKQRIPQDKERISPLLLGRRNPGRKIRNIAYLDRVNAKTEQGGCRRAFDREAPTCDLVL